MNNVYICKLYTPILNKNFCNPIGDPKFGKASTTF